MANKIEFTDNANKDPREVIIDEFIGRGYVLEQQTLKIASKKNIKLSELNLSDLTKVEPKINKNVFKILSPEKSIESKNSFGGTALREVKRQMRFWKRKLNA